MNRVLATLMVLLIGVPTAFCAYAVLARFVLHGPVDGTTLRKSLSDAANVAHDPGMSECDRAREPNVWRCTISDRSGSGGVDYLVRVEDDSSCWTARKLRDGGERPSRRAFDGCVKRWYWSLF